MLKLRYCFIYGFMPISNPYLHMFQFASVGLLSNLVPLAIPDPSQPQARVTRRVRWSDQARREGSNPRKARFVLQAKEGRAPGGTPWERRRSAPGAKG